MAGIYPRKAIVNQAESSMTSRAKSVRRVIMQMPSDMGITSDYSELKLLHYYDAINKFLELICIYDHRTLFCIPC